MLKHKLNYLVDFITWLPLLALKTSTSLSQKKKINFEIKESQPRESSSAFLSQRGQETLLYVLRVSPARNYSCGSFICLLPGPSPLQNWGPCSQMHIGSHSVLCSVPDDLHFSLNSYNLAVSYLLFWLYKKNIEPAGEQVISFIGGTEQSSDLNPELLIPKFLPQ